MKKCSSVYILLSFAGIIIIMLAVILYAYKPHFAEKLSNDNADWGNFGQFFWGLGTMLLTALNVYVFYHLTTIIEKSKEERDNRIYNLQKEQLENEQRMVLIKELTTSIEAFDVANNFYDVRASIVLVLNKIAVYRNLFISVSNDKLNLLKTQILEIEIDDSESWGDVKKTDPFNPHILPRKQKFIEELVQLENEMWKDLDIVVNR